MRVIRNSSFETNSSSSHSLVLSDELLIEHYVIGKTLVIEAVNSEQDSFVTTIDKIRYWANYILTDYDYNNERKVTIDEQKELLEKILLVYLGVEKVIWPEHPELTTKDNNMLNDWHLEEIVNGGEEALRDFILNPRKQIIIHY